MDRQRWFVITGVVLLIGLAIWLVVRQVREHYAQKDPVLVKLKEKVAPLFDKTKKYTGVLSCINDRNFMDEITFYRGEKSYTINKEKIYLCLKDSKKGGEYYNEQILIYVLLHEIGHALAVNCIGHGPEFQTMFDALLDEAVKQGIYDPKAEIPLDYCDVPDEGAKDLDEETFEV